MAPGALYSLTGLLIVYAEQWFVSWGLRAPFSFSDDLRFLFVLIDYVVFGNQLGIEQEHLCGI